MDTDSAVERLKELGLYVHRHVPIGMSDRERTDGLTIARSAVRQEEIDTLIDVCLVFSRRSAWVYRHWCGIGGRAPDDVHIEDLTLETAISHVQNFYFGNPLIVDGWSFPIHKHPEWASARIVISFDAACQVSQAQWREVKATRYHEARNLEANAKFLLTFREIESVQPDRPVRLWARNDLAEMFLVYGR